MVLARDLWCDSTRRRVDDLFEGTRVPVEEEAHTHSVKVRGSLEVSFWVTHSHTVVPCFLT